MTKFHIEFIDAQPAWWDYWRPRCEDELIEYAIEILATATPDSVHHTREHVTGQDLEVAIGDDGHLEVIGCIGLDLWGHVVTGSDMITDPCWVAVRMLRCCR